MDEQLIAPCGMNCAICASHLALTHDIKSKGIKMPYCPGCLPGVKNCRYKRKCKQLGKGHVRFCYDCDDFPCYLIKTLDKRYRTFYHMSMIENLEFMKKYGVSKFLDKQMELWKCPSCGDTICCHNGVCYSCGLDILKTKKKKYRWSDTEK